MEKQSPENTKKIFETGDGEIKLSKIEKPEILVSQVKQSIDNPKNTTNTEDNTQSLKNSEENLYQSEAYQSDFDPNASDENQSGDANFDPNADNQEVNTDYQISQ